MVKTSPETVIVIHQWPLHYGCCNEVKLYLQKTLILCIFSRLFHFSFSLLLRGLLMIYFQTLLFIIHYRLIVNKFSQLYFFILCAAHFHLASLSFKYFSTSNFFLLISPYPWTKVLKKTLSLNLPETVRFFTSRP